MKLCLGWTGPFTGRIRTCSRSGKSLGSPLRFPRRRIRTSICNHLQEITDIFRLSLSLTPQFLIFLPFCTNNHRGQDNVLMIIPGPESGSVHLFVL